MPFELINSLASVGTFAVIAASAIAAMIQLRRVRASNQIALMTKLLETLQSADFVDARRFIAYELADALGDPQTVDILRTPPFAGRMRALGLAVMSEDWLAHHPGGNYAKGSRRMVLPAIAHGRQRQQFSPSSQRDTLGRRSQPTPKT